MFMIRVGSQLLTRFLKPVLDEREQLFTCNDLFSYFPTQVCAFKEIYYQKLSGQDAEVLQSLSP
jgi:hypothetical protein